MVGRRVVVLVALAGLVVALTACLPDASYQEVPANDCQVITTAPVAQTFMANSNGTLTKVSAVIGTQFSEDDPANAPVQITVHATTPSPTIPGAPPVPTGPALGSGTWSGPRLADTSTFADIALTPAPPVTAGVIYALVFTNTNPAIPMCAWAKTPGTYPQGLVVAASGTAPNYTWPTAATGTDILFKAWVTETPDASSTSVPANDCRVALGTSNYGQRVAQTFTAHSTGVLNKVSAILGTQVYGDDPANAPITVAVTALTAWGSPDQYAVLGTGTWAGPRLADTSTFAELTIDPPVAVTAGTGYALVFTNTNLSQPMCVWSSTPGSYPDGQLFENQDAPGWVGVPGTDALFKTFVVADRDGDRVPDAAETNTGHFVNPKSTGTNPTLADSDGDGINDGDEIYGTTSGLYLPALGVSPTKKNILLEYDWFDDNNESTTCGPHSHRPTPGMIAKVDAAFANAPVPNPDGTTGITVIDDYGQGGAFTGGNKVTDADGVIAGRVDGADFADVKYNNFAAYSDNRSGYFHYVLLPHAYDTNSLSSGQAEITGDDLIVSLGCYTDPAFNPLADQYVANTIVHELGHNLGLRHGGDTDTNYKPNYNSVMNYQFDFPGVDTNCDRVGDGVLTYSTGSRASLNEAALVEANGICGGVAIDWNGNLTTDPTPVQADINNDGSSTGVLTDFNDWAHLDFAGISDADGAPVNHEIVTEQPVPEPQR